MALEALFDAAPSGKVELSCSACGKAFLRYRGHLRSTKNPYCSHDCRFSGREFPCQGCGKPLYRKRYLADKIDSGDVEAWCSRECISRHKRFYGTCSNCGEEFSTPQSLVKRRGDGTYCSRECKDSHGRETVVCFWPGCSNEMTCRSYTARDGARRYKTMLTRKGNYTLFPICREHMELCTRHLGENFRLNGRLRWLENLDHDMGSRAVAARVTRLVIFEKSKGKCASCGVERQFDQTDGWHIDHAVPVYQGGKTTFHNLQMLCVPCHDQKTAIEKSDVARRRGELGKIGRWMTHPEKDALIAALRAEIDDLRTRLAQAA